jgi:hypothetical protein
MKNFKLISMMFAAAISLTLASCNTTPPIPDSTQSSSGTTAQTKAAKYINPHYDQWGHLTNILHRMSIDEYYAIMDYLLASGADPSPENIDEVYDHMRH